MKLAACTSILGLALCGAAHALPPDQVFERAAPGLWALRTLDSGDQPFNHGSAVAIASGKAVTSCSLLARASRIELHRDKVVLAATLEFPDAARDLCQLDVPGLQAQEPARAAPRMGQRVLAIGYERGAEMSITEGLFSRVREAGSDAERIQTSVPTTGGLLGAGLFDEEARLLGLVTISPRDASGVVSALPARWLAELPERGRAVLASRAAGAAAKGAAGGLPAVGTSWSYSYTLRGIGGTSFTFGVRVAGVEGGVVQEVITLPSPPERRASVSADSLSFRSFPLPRSQTLVELAPYLHSVLAKNETRIWGKLAGYPAGNAVLEPWILAVREFPQEEVTVPAGTFKTTRIEVGGRRPKHSGFVGHLNIESGRFLFRAWYAPQVRRYVKLQHETWSLNGQWSGEQLVELLGYTAK